MVLVHMHTNKVCIILKPHIIRNNIIYNTLLTMAPQKTILPITQVATEKPNTVIEKCKYNCSVMCFLLQMRGNIAQYLLAICLALLSYVYVGWSE